MEKLSDTIDYSDVKSTAQRWGVAERKVTALCRDRRIIGAKKDGKTWLIPDDAELPPDGRTKIAITEKADSLSNQTTVGYTEVGAKNRAYEEFQKTYHVLTAAAILEIDGHNAAMDYHTLMKLTKILSRSNENDLEQMYRRMCFNVFAHNRDDHAKNFSWVYDEKQDCWHPTPAYDLTWSTTYFGEHFTTVDGNGRNPGEKELLSVGTAAGLSRRKCKDICSDIATSVADLEEKYRNIKT